MPATTAHFGLTKPGAGETVNIATLNADLDAIDNALNSAVVLGGNSWLISNALAQSFRIAGTPTYDATYGTLTAAAIAWPDGTTGAYATTSLDSNGAPLGFTATYVGTTTKTVTVTIPRNAQGQVNAAVTVSVA